MQETDAQFNSALRHYVTLAIRGHADAQQLDRAYTRGELTFRVEYDSITQLVRVSGINRTGQAMVISERRLGS